jgi:regulator of protease activity HflC (stomatin/prohibitin superfamily)
VIRRDGSLCGDTGTNQEEAFIYRRREKNMATYEMKTPPDFTNSPKFMGAGMIAIFVLLILFNSVQVVGPGERGIVFSQISGLKPLTLGEGLHFKIPFIETIITMDVRIQKSQTEAPAASKDLQNISTTIAVNFHIDPDRAQVVYQQIGRDFANRVIDPAIQESVKAATAHFTAEELIARRGEVKDQTQASLSERLSKFNIIVDELSIVDFSFSDQFNRAIEEKQTAEQQALKAKRDLDRIKIEADQRVTQAQAEAEAQRLQRETVSPALLQLRAIEKWNGVMPQVVGSGGMPFIDLKSVGGK